MITITNSGAKEEVLPNKAVEISDNNPVLEIAFISILTEPIANTRSQLTPRLNFWISSKRNGGRNMTPSPIKAIIVGLITGIKLVKNHPTMTAEIITIVLMSFEEKATFENVTDSIFFSGFIIIITLSANNNTAGRPTEKPTAHHFAKVTSLLFSF